MPTPNLVKRYTDLALSPRYAKITSTTIDEYMKAAIASGNLDEISSVSQLRDAFIAAQQAEKG